MSLSEFRYSRTFGARFPWGSGISWKEGEKPTHWIEGVAKVGLPVSAEGRATYLILTPLRLVYAAVIEAAPVVLSEVNLEDVILASSSGPRSVRLIEKGSEPVEYIFNKEADLEQLMRVINEMAMLRRAEISAQRDEELRLVKDFAALNRLLERAGIIVQSLKCFSCGSSVKLPVSGKEVNCEFCGTKLNAPEIVVLLRKSIG